MRCSRLLALTVLTLTLAGLARADVYYDHQARCLRVVDYPQALPCTLHQLLYMDQLYGWHKVTYDPAADTYTVTGNLWIGANDGTDTCLQIGSREHPHETLIMQGNLVVCPYWIKGLNSAQTYWQAPQKINRLTIGVRGDDAVTPALKFRDPDKAGYSLIIGRLPLPDGGFKQGYGGQLQVYHGTITSANPGQPFGLKSAPGGMCLCGDSIVLDHALLSWISGAATYGMAAPHEQVNDTVFDHVGTAIINSRQDLTNCTFSNCQVAVKDYGALDAVLTDCTFHNNNRNWTLTYSDRGLTCIDCTIDPPRQADVYQGWQNKRSGKMQYPHFVSKRHIIVEVVDQAGQPVPGATVKVRCEGDATEMAENATQQTGKLGRTPGQGKTGAVLLTEMVKQATDVPNHPQTSEFTYRVEASAEGFAPATLDNLQPHQSWQVFRLTLHKQ